MACLKDVMACPLLFLSANLIDAIQNEPVIWDTTVNASEEEKRDGVSPNVRPVRTAEWYVLQVLAYINA